MFNRSPDGFCGFASRVHLNAGRAGRLNGHAVEGSEVEAPFAFLLIEFEGATAGLLQLLVGEKTTVSVALAGGLKVKLRSLAAVSGLIILLNKPHSPHHPAVEFVVADFTPVLSQHIDKGTGKGTVSA